MAPALTGCGPGGAAPLSARSATEVGAGAGMRVLRHLGLRVPDDETHLLWRHPGGLAIAILNLYPYTSGHLMVMPIRHVGEVEELTGEESARCGMV